MPASETTRDATPPSAEGGARDLYAYDRSQIEEPPRSYRGMLRRIGPGIILSASIVGSGELIATTNLGAEVGFVALWIILISCVIKPAVQAELGRYSIATGETGLAGFNQVPGPRFRVNWIVWLWAVMVLITLFQIGAMFGGVAQVLHSVVPAVTVEMWVPALALFTVFLLLSGGYERVEKLATVKVALFTMLTFLCAVVLFSTPGSFGWNELASGLKFELPPKGLASAVAVFGITGVGASELFAYPYWCVEKGYARYAGPRDGSPEWVGRSKGWVRVMYMDIFVSMIIYTVATIAFYVLGAGVLHPDVPGERDMIAVLSRMYTETLGPWSLWLFYLGAIATLYGTIFAATASNSRAFADMARLLGAFGAGDYKSRVRWRNGFICGLIVIPVILYFSFQSPVAMVKLGGLAQASMLPVIAVGALYLRFRRLPREVTPGTLVTVSLVAASVVIIIVMAYYAVMASQ